MRKNQLTIKYWRKFNTNAKILHTTNTKYFQDYCIPSTKVKNKTKDVIMGGPNSIPMSALFKSPAPAVPTLRPVNQRKGFLSLVNPDTNRPFIGWLEKGLDVSKPIGTKNKLCVLVKRWVKHKTSSIHITQQWPELNV